MRLAKNHVDVGVFTNNAARMLEFWQNDVGLPFEELLPVGAGVRQHRHGMNGSVFKLNDAREPLPPELPAGYRELFIARPGVESPRHLVDPDGNRVTLVPPGFEGIEGIAMRVAARDDGAFHDFYGRILGLESAGRGRFRCGDSLLLVEHDPAAVRAGEMRAKGFRYLTVQVFDCDAEHARFIELGAEEGRPPVTLGTTARVSFIRDPGGNWIEVSQRASLVGSLPR